MLEATFCFRLLNGPTSPLAAIFLTFHTEGPSKSFQSILDDETVDYPMGVRQSATILFPDSGSSRSEKSSCSSAGGLYTYATTEEMIDNHATYCRKRSGYGRDGG